MELEDYLKLLEEIDKDVNVIRHKLAYNMTDPDRRDIVIAAVQASDRLLKIATAVV